jgi:hypothetical protein
MANSSIDICNLALTKVGAERISSFDDQTKGARTCKDHYEETRDALLRSHPWNFAIKRASLVELSETIPWGFSNAFALPSDFLRILGTDTKNVDFKIENGKLYTNDTGSNVLYIFKNEVVATYDPNFVEALGLKLAAKICYLFTTSNTRERQLVEEFELIVSRARSFDAQEGFPDSIEADTWIRSRQIGTIIGSGDF